MYHTLRSSSVGELSGRDAVPLDDLVSVIKTLKARLHTHRKVLEANETRTRMALIDPLLQALGWDTADPALVLPEYDLRGYRADYALLDGTGEPVAVIEAKRLGESLASHQIQFISYANLSGVSYAGLTDGNQWELYKVFDPAPIEDRLLLNVSIEDQPAHEIALKLLLLWQPNLATGQPVEANEPVTPPPVAGPEVESSAPPPEPVKAQPVAQQEVERPPASTPEPAPEPPPMGAGWVPLSKEIVKRGVEKDAPKVIRFPDGRTRELKHWWQLAEAIIEWLWSGKKLTERNIPLKMDKRYLVGIDGKHPIDDPHPIDGTPLVLEKKNSKEVFVNQVTDRLQKCGINATEVQLYFGEHLSVTVTETERSPAPTPEQAPDPPPATAEERLRRATFGSEPPSDSSPAAAGWMPLSEVAPARGDPAPAAIRFPDGSTRAVKVWWRLLEAIIGWLLSNGSLTVSEIPVKWGDTRYLVSTEDKHPTGKQFEQPRQIDFDGEILMLEGKTGNKEAVSKAKRLLQEHGVSLADVQLQVGED